MSTKGNKAASKWPAVALGCAVAGGALLYYAARRKAAREVNEEKRECPNWPPKRAKELRVKAVAMRRDDDEFGQYAKMCAAALEEDFAHVSAEVVDCPDLTQWGLAAAGLDGDAVIVEVGGVPNLFEPHLRDSTFLLPEVTKAVGAGDNAYVVGPGGGAARRVGVNSEWVGSDHLGTGVCCSKVALVGKDGRGELRDFEHSEFGLMGNLLVSKGERGRVLHVKAKCRTTDGTNFISSLRQGLAKAIRERRWDQEMAFGGVFRVHRGKVKTHIMPEFPDGALTDESVGEWLNWFEYGGPDLTCVTVFVTDDPTDDDSLHIRKEHTHFFNARTGEGGHYHFSTTPEDVEYEAYLVPCSKFYRVEDPYDDLDGVDVAKL